TRSHNAECACIRSQRCQLCHHTRCSDGEPRQGHQNVGSGCKEAPCSCALVAWSQDSSCQTCKTEADETRQKGLKKECDVCNHEWEREDGYRRPAKAPVKN